MKWMDEHKCLGIRKRLYVKCRMEVRGKDIHDIFRSFSRQVNKMKESEQN